MSSAPSPVTNSTTPPPSVSPPPPPVISAPSPSTPPPPVLSPPPPASISPPPPGSTLTSPPPSSSTPTFSPPPPINSVSPPPPTPTSSATPSPPSSSSTSSLNNSVIIGIAVAGVVILIVLGLLCFCCTKKRKRRRSNDHGNEHYYIPPPAPIPKAQHWQQSNPPPADQFAMTPKTSQPPNRPPPPTPPPFMNNSSGGSGSSNAGSGMEFGFSKNAFTYEELERATQGFSDDNLLGQGGFGYVHKGVLPNGKEVAVKSLKEGSVQGDREFQAEVEIISRVHHKHLVSLVGYCIAESQRMLVYEFVTNKTLEFHLHGKSQPPMNWPTRLKIALGSAKGLAYLHEDCHPKIIHRDIKAANILLDFKFEAKVADFGLAKFSSDLNTHISTRVMGTFGYLAPEYASSGKLTEKSDVFSYGVMLLELITGHRPVASTYTDDCLVDWARPLLTRALEDNNYDSLADQRLQKSYDQNEMGRMVACAAACVRHSARHRPRMSQVVRALEGNVSLEELNGGMRPGLSRVRGSNGSSDYETGPYKEDINKMYGSSEYGLSQSGTSSEPQTTREMRLEFSASSTNQI